MLQLTLRSKNGAADDDIRHRRLLGRLSSRQILLSRIHQQASVAIYLEDQVQKITHPTSF